MNTIPLCLQELGSILNERSRDVYDLPRGFQRAAVLVPFLKRNDDWFLIFTRRTDQVSHHKNEISFPGGKFDELDGNLIQTALREAYEELGIQQISILGLIDDLFTISKYVVTPVIGYIKDHIELENEIISEPEIDYVLEVPVAYLTKPNVFSIKKVPFKGSEFKVPFFDYKGEIIWGATGRILVNLFSILNLLNEKCRYNLMNQEFWEKSSDKIIDINPRGGRFSLNRHH